MEMSIAELLSILVLVTVVILTSYFARRIPRFSSYNVEFNDRFVYGIPWATVLIAVLTIIVFRGVQQAGDPANVPLVIPFRSWSVTYLPGILLSGITHMNESHLLGNLVWLLIFGTLLEYYVGHYNRGSQNWSVDRSTYVGALVDRVPFNVTGSSKIRIAGIVGSIYGYTVGAAFITPGATVGLSGAVFAIIGVLLIVWPRSVVLGVLVTIPTTIFIETLTTPIVRVSETIVHEPGWVTTSLPSHYIGLLIGISIGFLFIRQGGETSRSVQPWMTGMALIVLGVFQELYAFAYPVSNGYEMYRAIGLTVLVLLAFGVSIAVSNHDWVVSSRLELTAWELGIGAVICLLLAFSVTGILYNAAPVVSTNPETPNGANQSVLTVDEYTIQYAEDVPDAYQTQIRSPIRDGKNTSRVSGVIVSSEKRDVWDVAIPARSLRGGGSETFVVGSVGSRESIAVERSEWSAVSGGTTYRVTARNVVSDSGELTQADSVVLFESGPAAVSHRIDGYRMQIAAVNESYQIGFVSNETVIDQVGLEMEKQYIQKRGPGDIVVVRSENQLFVSSGDTQLHIAEYQEPRG